MTANNSKKAWRIAGRGKKAAAKRFYTQQQLLLICCSPLHLRAHPGMLLAAH
jgi:hypothetical protein